MPIKIECSCCGEEAVPFRHRQCEDCVREKRRDYTKGWAARNPSKVLEIRARHNAAHPEKMMWYAARQRARAAGRDFSIAPSDIIIPTVCPVLGIELSRAPKGIRSGSDSSPSLDRIDNSKGYVPGNVAVISYRANRIKSNATAHELERVAMYMAGHRA